MALAVWSWWRRQQEEGLEASVITQLQPTMVVRWRFCPAPYGLTDGFPGGGGTSTAVVVVLELALQVSCRQFTLAVARRLCREAPPVNHLILFTQGSLAAVA